MAESFTKPSCSLYPSHMGFFQCSEFLSPLGVPTFTTIWLRAGAATSWSIACLNTGKKPPTPAADFSIANLIPCKVPPLPPPSAYHRIRSALYFFFNFLLFTTVFLASVLSHQTNVKSGNECSTLFDMFSGSLEYR